MAALSLTLMAVPSQAAWDDHSPPPGGDVGSNTGEGGNGFDFRCGKQVANETHAALYIYQSNAWRRWWEAGYPPCVNLGPRTYNTGAMELCPSGFLVYRFYGKLSDPDYAVTRSRLNLTAWCAWENSYSFPATNPLDVVGADVDAPWKAELGHNPDLKIQGGAINYEYFRNDARKLVPTRTTNARTSSGTCQDLQTNASVRTWFESVGESQRVGMRATLGYLYWKASGRGAHPASGLAQAGLRTANGYQFNWDAWKQNNRAAPVADPSGDAFYLTDFTWEERGCASPFQFLHEEKTPVNDRAVVGTCYIPLVRKRTEINISNGTNVWKYPTLQHDWSPKGIGYGDGERMSTFYRGTKYTPGNDTLDADVTGFDPAQQLQLINGWRDAMVTDYSAWAAAGATSASGEQIVPANPYRADRDLSLLKLSTPIDFGAAAATLRDSARCRVGTNVQFDTPEITPASNVHASVNVDVVDQEVLQVSPTEAKITLKAAALQCGGGPCDPKDEVAVESLSWDASATGTSGFKLCPVSTGPLPTACDGTVTSSKVIRGKIQTSQELTVRFVHPTSAAQAVRVSVTNLKGTYGQIVMTAGLHVELGADVIEEGFTIDTGPLAVKVSAELPVTASAKPVPLTAEGSGYRVDMPVIGAVQVPVS